jgi:hypothetical protein
MLPVIVNFMVLAVRDNRRCMMASVLWTGLRQIEAIRESVTHSLGGAALSGRDSGSVNKWLTKQGLPQIEGFDETTDRYPTSVPPAMISTAVNVEFNRSYGKSLGELARRIDSPDPRLSDYGAARGGAGWQNPPNLIITSAFVRSLGASEQFEIDVFPREGAARSTLLSSRRAVANEDGSPQATLSKTPSSKRSETLPVVPTIGKY